MRRIGAIPSAKNSNLSNQTMEPSSVGYGDFAVSKVRNIQNPVNFVRARQPVLYSTASSVQTFMNDYSSYVFIVTYGRSGSTLLQRILNSIDGYFIRGENENALFGLYQSYSAALRAKTNFGKKETGEQDPWYGADLLEPERYGRKLARLFLNEIIQPGSDARVVGFKEIRFFLQPFHIESYLQFIETFFHPAKLIFNVRNPNDVAGSAWWRKKDREEVITNIQKFHQIADGYIAKYPNNCFKVRYDDYKANPNHLKGLFEFLGEPFEEEKIRRIMATRLKH